MNALADAFRLIITLVVPLIPIIAALSNRLSDCCLAENGKVRMMGIQSLISRYGFTFWGKTANHD